MDSTTRHRQTSSPSLGSRRQESWSGSIDGGSKSPSHSRKRSRERLTSDAAPITRKGRACLACRKLKVKCDSLERGDAGCSRCNRLGLECIASKRLRVSLDDDVEQAHLASIVRLDRAVEDILSRMKMPSLESYSRSQPLPESVAQTTRENSREPALPEAEHEMAPAPMGSLFEVTQLNTLRSRLKRGETARRGSKKSMESDLVSLGMISMDEAEEMLLLYKTSLSRYLFNATITDERTLQSVRESSTLFFTAIMCVSSLHLPGKEKIYAQCHKQLRELITTGMFDRFHNLEDIRALCIAAFWLPDLSWKLSGHCVRMATELNLHQAFYKAFHSRKQSASDREHALEGARLWYLLYILDHHFSIAYGRPPVTAELQAIKEYETFLKSPECTTSDKRLVSQVTLFIILSKAYNVFGLEAERLMDGDDVTLLIHQRFIEDLDRWAQQYEPQLIRDPHIGDYPSAGVSLHYNFASMMLNSLALRGRSLDELHNLPRSLRPLALHAIESAHRVLQTALEHPSIRDSLVGVPLYLHSMIAFAVVFLIKMSSRWKIIGVTIDPDSRTRPLIEGIINLLRGCKANASHILYSMATGFERLLNRSMPPNKNAVTGKIDSSRHLSPLGMGVGAYPNLAAGFNGGHSHQSALKRSASTSIITGNEFPAGGVGTAFGFDADATTRANGSSIYNSYGISPDSAGTQTFPAWQQSEDDIDMLWNMGLGYDLLANAGDMNASSNFTLQDMLYPPAG